MQRLKLILLLLCACAAVWAQSTAQIQGVVQDQSGSAIPGADVKATQTATGATRTVTSSGNGGYVLTNLPIGPYRLEVSKGGFGTFVQTGIILQVASNPTVDIAMKVGAVSDQVQVEANAALVETEKTGVGSVIENQRILELPLNGRNPTDLIQLAGAAIPAGAGGGGSIFGMGLSIVVAGGQTFGVAYWLDGALYTNPFDATSLPFPFPDALQEFKVETSSLTAQYGIHSGASINAVSKVGTNSLHGDVFEFLRNGDLNARNFFSAGQDTLKRNQFGGTAGGAIIKNKLFYFGGYQNTIVRQEAVSQTTFVPSVAMLNGNFAPFVAANCLGGAVLNLPGGLPNNQVDKSTFSPAALKIAKLLPTSTDPCGATRFGAPTQSGLWMALGRLDYQISDKNSLFGRYQNTAYYQPSGYGISGNILSTTTGGRDSLHSSILLGDTYLISSTMVNSFRVSFNRVANTSFNAPFFDPCDIGVKFTCFLPHQTAIAVTGGFSIGGCCVPTTNIAPTIYQWSDDVSIVRGAHQFTFGFSEYQYRSTTRAFVFAQGIFGFNGTGAGLNGKPTNSGLADFLVGNLGTVTDGAPNTLLTRKNYISGFAQDTWKITPHLTANIGIRWEPFIPQTMTNGAIYNFSLPAFAAGTKSTVYNNAPPGVSFPGDPGFYGNAGMAASYNKFAPRLGLAWDPKGDGKMVIRAGYGLSYDFVNGAFFANTATAPPFANTTTLRNIRFDDPWATIPGGNIFPYSPGKNAPFAGYGTYIAIDPHAKPTQVGSWNLAIQRQFGNNLLVSATYLGNETSHLWQTYQANPAPLVANTAGTATGTCPPGVVVGCNSTGNINQRRLLGNPLIGYMDQFTSGGTSSYNGLLLAVQKRLSNGLSFGGNYTWSHCIGDASQGSGVGGSAVGYVDPNNRKLDHGNCVSRQIAGEVTTDRRHILNLTLVAMTPRFSNKTMRMLGTGWRGSVIYRASSGGYISAFTSSDRQLSGQNNERLVQIQQDPLLKDNSNSNSACFSAKYTCVSWINPKSFAAPAFGTLSTLAPANILGPGFFQADLALSREFKIREYGTVELRGEAFNISNSFRAGVPGVGGSQGNGLSGVTQQQTGQFGQILSAMDPRILQLAMKFVF